MILLSRGMVICPALVTMEHVDLHGMKCEVTGEMPARPFYWPWFNSSLFFLALTLAQKQEDPRGGGGERLADSGLSQALARP